MPSNTRETCTRYSLLVAEFLFEVFAKFAATAHHVVLVAAYDTSNGERTGRDVIVTWQSDSTMQTEKLF